MARGSSFSVEVKGVIFGFGTAHLPHQQRPDAEDVWLSDLSKIDELLACSRHHDVILLGIDANQNVMNSSPCFAALSRLQMLDLYRGLEFSSPHADTWVARGESSTIDWFLFRWPMVETTYHLREDLRLALPSDHNPLVGLFRGRTGLADRPPRPRHGCGRWKVDGSKIEAAASDPNFAFSQESFASLCRKHSVRMPSRRYKDPPQVQELIRKRKVSQDYSERARLAAEVVVARNLARKEHKISLLQAARQGDKGAIGHLRRSSLQSFSDGSLIERLGGHDRAVAQVKEFYERKYSLSPTDTPVSDAQEEALHQWHASEPPAPITREEVSGALSEAKGSTASGLDSVCYSAIDAYHKCDSAGKLVGFFNEVLSEARPLPADWLRGKICLLPKVPGPSRVQDLRPISLTPCLGKIFSKILIKRLRSVFPAYGAGQHANRPGTQALEAVWLLHRRRCASTDRSQEIRC